MDKSVYSDRDRKFRALLIAARKAARLTQADLARRIGADQAFVSKYERGDRRLDVVEFLRIAEALEVDPAAIMAVLREPLG